MAGGRSVVDGSRGPSPAVIPMWCGACCKKSGSGGVLAVGPYFKLVEADHVLVRLALFGKVRLFIGSSPGEAVGIGQRHPICSAFRNVGWRSEAAGDVEIRVREFPGGETRLRRRWSASGRQARQKACFDVVRGWEEESPKIFSCEDANVFR